MKHIFHIYHPVVVFVYILSVLVLCMVTLNPVLVAVSFLLGSVYSIYLNGMEKYLKTLRYTLFLFLVIALMNPLFNHKGMTILFYLFDNPITLEAVAYGVASGGMLASVLVWFTCYNALITNDKFLFLFGKILPTISLMLSMIIRLVPVTNYKIRCINNAQKTMGIGSVKGTRKQQIANRVRVSSILMSWSMEDCIETADSMKSRGYGSGKRTAFTNYKWCAHDIVSLAVVTLLILVNGYLIFANLIEFKYYPVFRGELFNWAAVMGYAAYGLLLLYPLLMELRERFRWT